MHLLRKAGAFLYRSIKSMISTPSKIIDRVKIQLPAFITADSCFVSDVV
jgi:hypothetical protein